MSIFTPALTLGLALISGLGPLATDSAIASAPATKNMHGMIILADFDGLDSQSKRRLEYYATQILTDIGEMAALERSGDMAAVDRGLAHARQLAIRMATAANEYGLTRSELLDFFLSKLRTDMTGPLPNAIIRDDGSLMIFSLFEDINEANSADQGNSDYINLLRSEDPGS